MRLVDDDGEIAVAHIADGIADEGELLYRGDDDTLVVLNVLRSEEQFHLFFLRL